ncbi:unnamed protein product [Miscanthus lutarioriparius]|uniref:NB-ARC domain-containing protein n=1 Tax=Miscanthus lutarioriparius TaxID=422564 RepID=A0A811RF90_9POAL|nr:unnamed protein product [Miscanthus lutarioriparius]
MAVLAPKLGELLTAEYVVQKGLKPDIESLSKELVMMKASLEDSSRDLKVVSIVGFGGLGKTTLAKTVHDMLKKQFGCSAFISVGRTPNLTRTFEKILVEFDKKYKQVDMARWDIEQFGNELHEFLTDKRYFIVVDDIWDVESWKAIRYALKDNNCGSRIIMTTRNFEVATKAGEVYRLKPLSHGNSKKLFYKRIQSHKGESVDGVSDELSSKIIDKCGGIPLAIIAIASLLVERPYDDWSKSVIWMWIGEGFVHLEKEDGSLFEAGERYFNELVNRSMIQTMKDRYDPFTQWFRIHDIVFDLISKLSRDENFVTFLGSMEQHASPDSLRREKNTSIPRSDSKVRRLAVKNHLVQRIREDTMDMPEVMRSLNIFDSKIEVMAPLHSFRVCRVLYIENYYVPISLKHIGKLLHLKYLEISSYTPVDELPKELGHLKSLQTLYLKKTGLDELPPAVCSLTQLMCLVAIGFRRLPADRMGSLTSLEDLRLDSVVGRNATEDLVVALGKLTRLRNLRTSASFYRITATGSQCDLDNLERLPELTYLELVSFSCPPGYTVGKDGFRNLRFCRVDTTLKFSMGAMPRLEELRFRVNAGYSSGFVNDVPLEQFPTKDEIEDLDLGLDNLLSLEKVTVTVDCSGATAAEVQEVEAMVTRAVENHPNRRTIKVDRAHEGNMLSDEESEDLLQQHIQQCDRVLSSKDEPDAWFIAHLRWYRLLQKAVISIDCAGASLCEVEKVEAAFRHAAEVHHNHPTIQLIRTNTDEMVSSSDHLDTESFQPSR